MRFRSSHLRIYGAFECCQHAGARDLQGFFARFLLVQQFWVTPRNFAILASDSQNSLQFGTLICCSRVDADVFPQIRSGNPMTHSDTVFKEAGSVVEL